MNALSTIEHVTLSELQELVHSLQLPTDIRFTVTFKDKAAAQKLLKRRKAIEAMKKLRGSGNGNLVSALLTEREKDTLL